jgi:hypothetical protein
MKLDNHNLIRLILQEKTIILHQSKVLLNLVEVLPQANNKRILKDLNLKKTNQLHKREVFLTPKTRKLIQIKIPKIKASLF